MLSPLSHPIGIFDSGVGGLTVLQELIRKLPRERFIYFGDTARVPYGNKAKETILRYAIESTLALLEKEIKLLVIACNTVSALALPKLRSLFKIPIIGVIEPGAQKAVDVTKNQRIAVIGTRATIQSGAYQMAIRRQAPHAHVIPVACPLFVPLVEEKWLDHPATLLISQDYLCSLRDQGIDTLLLGCTHYPLLQAAIQEAVGEEVSLVDSASTCADQTALLLEKQGLLSPLFQGKHEYYTSDDPEKFSALGEHLFGTSFERVERLSIEQVSR